MLPELDSRRQPEFAMEHSMGRQGGARRPRQLCARCAARTLGASLCARALPPGRPLGLLLLRPSPPPPGSPQEGGLGGTRRASARAGVLASAREKTAREGRCARGWMRGAGRQAVTLEPPEPGLQRAVRVRVRACARVCSGGRGSPWRTPTSNRAPRGGAAQQPIPHLTPRPPAALAPPPRPSSDCSRVWGLESARRPLPGEGAALPALRPHRKALGPAWRSQKRLS